MFEFQLPKPSSEFARAASAGNVDALKKLLSSNPEAINQPEVNQMTLLAYGAANGKSDAVDYLLNNGADIAFSLTKGTLSGASLLHLAVLGGNTDVVKMLAGKGLDVNATLSDKRTTPHGNRR